jgi:hypothetical protein
MRDIWQPGSPGQTAARPGRVLDPRSIPVYPDAGEKIPAASFAEIASYDSAGRAVLVKPTEDNLTAARLVITPGHDLPDNATGAYAYPASQGQLPVNYDGDAPAAGDDFGTEADNWSAVKGNTGFRCSGTSGGRAVVSPFNDIEFKTSSMGDFTYHDYSQGGPGGNFTFERDWVYLPGGVKWVSISIDPKLMLQTYSGTENYDRSYAGYDIHKIRGWINATYANEEYDIIDTKSLIFQNIEWSVPPDTTYECFVNLNRSFGGGTNAGHGILMLVEPAYYWRIDGGFYGLSTISGIGGYPAYWIGASDILLTYKNG